jgi:hypothetical protein
MKIGHYNAEVPLLYSSIRGCFEGHTNYVYESEILETLNVINYHEHTRTETAV